MNLNRNNTFKEPILGMSYGDMAHYLHIVSLTTTNYTMHRTYMYMFKTEPFLRKIFNGLRIKTLGMKSLQLRSTSPIALNAILLKSKQAELRFAVLLTSLFFIRCMHIESIHYDTTPGIIITLVGEDVGGKCV